ncbi:probable inactive dual specificity protein phosphatase-like At4g18593 [Primulina huaijiensis]|uniref:probable inactive dual specificity protein phosphatase-like At4g18593 n=1 Tax=Primulina huaijiensis TaxID=1492673 RepID=UPI003CC7946F
MLVCSINYCNGYSATVDDTTASSDPKPSVMQYRCKKCRRIVASEEYIVSHELGVGPKRIEENSAGMQCNCGTWINHAFQLHKSRIDECRI